MKCIKTTLFILLSILIISCGKEGLSDQEIPESSRNSKLRVTVELCDANGNCLARQGKLVSIYEYEDEAMESLPSLQLVQTDTSGVADFGLVELESVYVTVRQNGILDISQVNLTRNTISHHLIQLEE